VGGLFLSGCSGGGGSGARVKGSVNLDGKPLAGAKIDFVASEGGGTIVTDDQGKFEFKGGTFDTLKPGKYQVFVTKFVDKAGKVTAPEEVEQLVAAGLAKNLVPAKYGDRQIPSLEVDVKAGQAEIPPIELKSK
jgi:hypothetical protein